LSKITEYSKKVYINQDLTFAQRAGLKLLLDERNKLNQAEITGKTPFRYVIRNDKLKKIEFKGGQ
jgi:hypothetical protein